MSKLDELNKKYGLNLEKGGSVKTSASGVKTQSSGAEVGNGKSRLDALNEKYGLNLQSGGIYTDGAGDKFLVSASATPVYAPTLEEERANERDKMLTPSVSRQTGKTANIPELRRAAEEMALDPNAFARASEKTSRTGDFVGALALGTGKTATNLGGVALEGLRALNNAAYEQNNAQQRTAQENSLAYWQQQLKSAKTQAERDRAQAQIDRASRALGAMDNLKDAETRDVMNAANKVYSVADNLSKQELALQERSKEGLGTVGTTLMDAGYSFAQSMMDGGIGALTGTGMLPFVARAFSGSAQEARQVGADFGQQMTYASSQAAKEYITEKLFGIALPQKVIGKAGRGGLDGVIENVIAKAVGKVESTGGQRALGGLLTWLTGGVTEGLEEGIGDFIENNILNPLLENKLPPELTTQNSKEDYLSDMLLGGISGLMGVTNLFTYSPNNATTERALEMLTGGNGVRSAPAAAQSAQERTQSVSRETAAPAQETPHSGAQAQTFARYYEQDVKDMTGELGGKAFVERYDGTQDIAEYTAGFVRYWNAGATGKKIGSVQNTGGLNELQRYAAYYAGQNDARNSSVSEQSGVRDVAINAQRGLSSDDTTARNTSAWSEELRGTVDTLGKKLGVRVVVDDTFEGVSANGYYDAKTNEIHLAKDAQNPVLQVVRHEATHRMQQLSPKEYRAFRDYAVRMAGEDAVTLKQAEYARGGKTLTNEEAMDEIAAETAEKLLTDETAISDFIRENRTAAQKFYDALRSIVQKVKEALGGDQTLAQAERLWKSAFEKADAQAQENVASKNAAQQDGVRYSLIGKTADGIEVYETSEEVRKLPYKERMERFLDIMRNEYRGRTAKFSTGNDVYYAKFDEADLLKNVYGDKKSSSRGWKAKINTGADGEIFELVENAQYKGSDTESGKVSAAHKGVTGWEYFVKTVQIDGKVYDLLANVRKKPDGEYVYSIQLNENKKKTPAPPVARAYTDSSAPDGYASERVLTDVSNGSITDTAENSKRKFSLKTDSDYLSAVERGDTETAQKMVDEAAKANGYNTPDLYHGTPSFGFTVFKDGGHDNPFIYASTKREVAAHYAGDKNYAFVRGIGKAYRDGDSVEDIIHNAKQVYGVDYRLMTDAEKKAVFDKHKAEADAVADKIDELYRSDFDFPEDVANAISWVSDLFYTLRDSDVQNPYEEEERALTEWLKWLDSDIAHYEESSRIIHDYATENWERLGEKEKAFLSYLRGYELGDVAIDIAYRLRKVLNKENLLISNAGNISVPVDLKNALDESHKIGAYRLYGNLGDNPFVFDAKGGQFYALKVPEFSDNYTSTDSVCKWALEHGYTSVVMKNIYDYGDKADNYVFFNSNQVKSADPVTYDDNGNVIPLSKRFNTQDKDIRYSLKTDSEGRELSAQQQEYFKDSKVVDTDGRLKVMYQGGNGEFTVFDRKKSKGSNLYGRGFYFTDSETQAKQYGGTRAFYLNVTNPLTPGQNSITREQMRDFLSAVAENEDYGLENYGYGATVDSVLESVYGKGDFEMLQDVNATAIGDLVAAAELFNEVNGTDYDGIILPTETVIFRSNQAKNVTNAAPTDNADIRFSLKSPVEETDDLIAVHNMTEKNLADALDLGGLPMPSIAVVKAKSGHSKYGAISLVFGKDTIDPRITSANRVYGGDAYTPTAPSIGYKIDYDVMKSIRDKLHSVLDDETYNAMHFHIDTDNLTDALKRNGGDFKQAYGRDRGMRLAFLKDTGKELRIPKKDVKYEVDVPALREIIKKFDVDSLYEMGYQGFDQNEPEVRKTLFDYTVTSKNQTVLDNGKTIAQVKAELTYGKKLPFSYYYNIIEDARKIKHNGVEKEVDTTRLDTRIGAYFKSKKTQAEYEAWLDDLSRGIVAKKGIRNNADPYTQTGNRRSFEALYDEYTLDNIVKAMKTGQEERGNQFFGASATTLQSVTTPSYGSISEIKEDSGRLARYDDEAYEAMKKEIDDELFAAISEIYDTTKHWSDNQFTEFDSIAEAVVNAARRGGTADAIVRSFKRDGYSINGDVAQRLKDLYRRSTDLPTEYFEAKPRRAVGFDEVRAVVAPKNLDPALKQRLEDEGIKVISYKTGDDADRTKKLNSINDVRFSLRDNSPEAVAAKQQEMIEYLRGQLRRSRGVTTKKGDVAKIARATAKAWDSGADVTARLQAMYDFMANGKDANGNELTWDDLWSEARSIAGDMLGESMTRNDDLYREYADLRRTVRDTKLNVPKELDGDLDAFGGYGEFRRGEGRALNLSRSEGTGIDDFFQTLADRYPEYFDEATTSNPADQLARIAEVMNDLKPVYENRFAGDEQAVNYLADELINSFYDARQEAPTFADKAALNKQEAVAKVKNAARDKMQTREAKLRGAYDERIAKMREMNRQKIDERMSKLREQRDNRIASLKQHYKEAEEARRNQKRDSEARTRLLNIARRLSNKKLPAVSKSLIQQYIGELDLTAKSMTGTTLERLTDLQAWYADQKETNPDFISDKNIEKALQRLSKKQIADLTADDVESLTRVLLNIENEIGTQRKLIDSQVRRDTYLAGDAAITDIENSKGSSGSKIDTFLLSETLSPMREMRRITGYVDSDPLYVVTQELADGQRKMFDYQRRANERFKEWVEDKEFIKTISGKDAKEITITGIGKDGVTSVKITPAMRMSLYLHSLNDQNLRHIAGGGITVPDITLYKKGNIVEAYNKGKTIKLKPSEVRKIASGMSEKEFAFARAAHDYYNGQSQSEINSTSERLKGYSVATVDSYFPVDTDRSFLKAEFDSIKRDGTIEGMGFLKERIDASNPIMLYDMNSVLTKSINQHSKYVGLAIPVRNFSKLWGVTTGSFNEDGSRNNFESSVQKAVKEKWGQNGYDYIEQMMADLNNISKGQKSWGKALASARSAYAGAVLELNASVAVKQAASYPTAASVVGFKPLIKALGDTSKINTDQIARYTPLLWYRSQGYSSQELGELAQRGKSLPKALNWIQAIDVATTTKLWKAAEYYVRDTRKDLERASEAYYREVANVYNRIIEETQPNYTTMQRPAILRSDNELVRTLNMFKTQPFQNFNILYDGIENMNAKRRAYESDGSEESRKAYDEAKTAAARAITSQAVSSFVFALMQYAWDAFRGKDDKYKDEDGEYSIGAWMKAMGFNMLTNGFGMFPFGSEVLEAAETLTDKIATTLGKDPVFDATYYGVDVSVVDTVNNTVNDSINGIVQTIATIQTAAEDDKNVNWESYARTMYKVIVDYAQLAGVPIDNVRKTAVAVAQQAFKAANGKYVGGYYALRLTSDPAKYSGDYYDLLYKAYKTDRKSYEEVFSLMVDSGSFAADKIKNAMETRMKDGAGVKSVKDLAQRYYTPEQQEQYDSLLSDVQKSSVWKKASEEQRKTLEKETYTYLAGSGDDAERLMEKIAEGKKNGLTESEYLLYMLALEMTEKPNEDGKIDGNPTNDELEEAIRMLQGLSDKERSYLWSTKRDSDKNNPWK